jgi:hypothetical protein
MARPSKDETLTSGPQTDEREGANGASGDATPSLSKKEMVQRALKALGPDAKPAKIHKWVLRKFKVDMSPNHISSYKSQLRGPDERPAPTGRNGASAEDVRIKDIQTLKELSDRLGPKKFRSLIDLLVPGPR